MNGHAAVAIVKYSSYAISLSEIPAQCPKHRILFPNLCARLRWTHAHAQFSRNSRIAPCHQSYHHGVLEFRCYSCDLSSHLARAFTSSSIILAEDMDRREYISNQHRLRARRSYISMRPIFISWIHVITLTTLIYSAYLPGTPKIQSVAFIIDFLSVVPV